MDKRRSKHNNEENSGVVRTRLFFYIFNLFLFIYLFNIIDIVQQDILDLISDSAMFRIIKININTKFK